MIEVDTIKNTPMATKRSRISTDMMQYKSEGLIIIAANSGITDKIHKIIPTVSFPI